MTGALAAACAVVVLLALASRYMAALHSRPHLAGAADVFELDRRRAALATAFADAGGRVCCDNAERCARQKQIIGASVATARAKVLPLCGCGGVVVHGTCHPGVLSLHELERLCLPGG